MTEPGQFFDPNMFQQYQQANPGAPAPSQGQFYGAPPAPPVQHPGYAPNGYGQYPPQQVPPAGPPAYYGPPPAQGGYAPQGYPQQGGYAPPPPVHHQVPAQEGSLDDFFNQSGGAGKSLEFKQVGQQYVVALKRDLIKGDVRQRTDPQTKQPVFDNQGKAKWVLVLPLVGPGSVDPSQLEDVSWWMSAADKDAMVEALTAKAGRPLKVPNKGTVMRITYVKDRPNRPPFAATKVKTVEVLKLGEGWEAHAEPVLNQESALADYGRTNAEPHVAQQPPPDFAAAVPTVLAAGPGTGPVSTAAPDEAHAMAALTNYPQVAAQTPVAPPVYAEAASPAYAQQGQQWTTGPGQHGGPVATAPPVPQHPAEALAMAPHPVGPAQVAQQPAPGQAPPGEDAVMAKMAELLGGK